MTEYMSQSEAIAAIPEEYLAERMANPTDYEKAAMVAALYVTDELQVTPEILTAFATLCGAIAKDNPGTYLSKDLKNVMLLKTDAQKREAIINNWRYANPVNKG